jgi:hypothetical protein
MFLKRITRIINGQHHDYWALVESIRTASGPRHRIMSYVGMMDESGRLGMEQVAEGQRDGAVQGSLFPDEPA